LRHDSHRVVDVVVRHAHDQVPGHDFADRNSIQVSAPVQALTQHVTLADDAGHRTGTVTHEQGADPVLHENGDRVENGLVGPDRVHLGSLDLEDLSDLHGSHLPGRGGTALRIGSVDGTMYDRRRGASVGSRRDWEPTSPLDFATASAYVWGTSSGRGDGLLGREVP